MELPDKIKDLIIAEVTDNITSEEKVYLEKWKNTDSDNFMKYAEYAGYTTKVKMLLGWDTTDVNKAKINFKRKLNMPKRHLLWLSAAASIIIILTVGITIFHIGKNNRYGGISEINPGNYRAKLTLSDGRTLELGDNERCASYRDEEVEINEDVSGKLTYSKSKKIDKTEIKYNTIVVPAGGEYQLNLSDGTKVWLNSETTLKYPTQFTGGSRKVILTGEAYFEVAHNPAKPFYVVSDVTEVRVLGTSFNVKSYRDDTETAVTLAEGKVNISVGNNLYTLIPGKQAVVNRSNREASLYDVDVDDYVSWKDGVFQFTDMPMYEIVKALGRWYNVEFVFSRESLKYERFSGAVTKYRNIEYILDLIESTNDVKFDIRRGKIIIR